MSTLHGSNGSLVAREACRQDCPGIVELIKKLAHYENMGDKVKIDSETLIRDGFTQGRGPYFHCLVAEENQQLVGYLLYYYTYSTFEGRSIYMEDIFVDPDHRRKGIGSRLLAQLAQKAISEECKRIDFSILDWNQMSINFHQSFGAVNISQQQGWQVYRLDTKCIRKLSEKNRPDQLANPES